MSGKVIVKVLQGKDLKSQEWIGDNAPYCKVHPRSFGAQNAEWRRTVARAPQVALGAANRLEQQWKRGKNPRWHDPATFNFQYDRASSAELELVCWPQVEAGEARHAQPAEVRAVRGQVATSGGADPAKSFDAD